MSGYCEYKDAMQSICYSPLLEQLAKRALGLYEEFNRPAKYLLEELPKEKQSLRQYDFSSSFDFRKYTDGKGGLKSLQANTADKAAFKFKRIYVYAGRGNSKTHLIKDIAEILDEPEPPFSERLRQAEFQRQIEEAEKAARLRGTVKVSKPDNIAALCYSFSHTEYLRRMLYD